MCVCVCVCVPVVRAFTPVYACRVHACMHARICVRIIHGRLSVYACGYVHTCVNKCAYVCMHTLRFIISHSLDI